MYQNSSLHNGPFYLLVIGEKTSALRKIQFSLYLSVTIEMLRRPSISILCETEPELSDEEFVRIHYGKLTKQGRHLFDDIQKAADITQKHLPKVSRDAFLKIKVENLIKHFAIPKAQFIDFDELSKLNSFPRFPKNKKRTVSLDEIDRSKSLLVFISHCWLRGGEGSEGWDGQPHPDNANNEKLQLCKRGIDQLRKTFAPGLKKCYVWLDYGCMDQNCKDISEELEDYDKLIQYCDCIFTPIVDPDHMTWQQSISISDNFLDYKASRWSQGPSAYLNRAWCRIEMLYASTIPLLDNDAKQRHAKFEAGLAFHCSQNRRPHFLYGTKECVSNAPPRILAPLQHSFLKEYDPAKGNLSHSCDQWRISKLMSDLLPHIDANRVALGYVGETNKFNEEHGKGRMVCEDGSVYEGSYKNGKRHGHGKLYLANGDTFEGEWQDNMTFGFGMLQTTDGSSIVGIWRNGIFHRKTKSFRCSSSLLDKAGWTESVESGHLEYKFSNPSLFEGESQKSLRNGHGVYRDADGSVYEGEWKNGLKHGQGIHRTADGSVYRGEWKNGEQDGHGVYVGSDSSEFEGTWKQGVKHGFGIAKFANGSESHGEWANDKRHGNCTVKFADGSSYQGQWNMGVKQGRGVYRFNDGSVYDGEFHNGLRHGEGTMTFADGSEYKGQWSCDRQSGQGVLKNKDGSVECEGDWQSGKYRRITLVKFVCQYLKLIAGTEKRKLLTF